MHLALAFTLASLPSFTLAPTAPQQTCAQWSAEFSGGGFDRPPLDFEVFDAGAGPRLVAGGEFTVAGSVAARRVAQWDGVSWSALGAGFSGDVSDLEVADLGSGATLFAAGRFQQSDGVPCLRIARWTGTSWVQLGAGLNGPCAALCAWPSPSGARLVAAGEFTMSGGQSLLRVAQWNGTNWAPLGAGIGSPFATERVTAIAVHDDGAGPALYAAGPFAGGVARFDGSTWTTVGGGVAGTLLSLASYDDGAGTRLLLAGGNFGTSVQSVLRGFDGTAWLEQGLASYGGGVDRILVRSEPTGVAAYLAGSFAPQAGASSSARTVARWTPAGATALPDLTDRARALEFFDAGLGAGAQLFVGGQFTLVPTAPTAGLQRVARLVNGAWSPVEPARHALYGSSVAPNLSGRALQAWTDPTTLKRDLYVGGSFSGASDDPQVRNLARWDGQLLHSVPTPFSQQITALCERTAPSGGAKELVAGTLSGAFAFDGNMWTLLGSPSPLQTEAFVEFRPPGASAPQLVALGSGILPAVPGGQFAAAFDGTAWTPLGSGLSDTAYAGVVWDAPGGLPEGLFVGGRFTQAGAVLAPGIALWDGVNWRPLGNQAQFFIVYELRVWDDGTGEQLYAHTDAGVFRFDGSNWTAVAPVLGALLEPYDDGSGSALYFSDRSRLRQGVVETFSSVPIGGSYPFVAREWSDEHGISHGLFFSGYFESQGSVPAVGLARYYNPCDVVRSYCTAKVSSLGCTPQIGWAGTPSVTASGPFVITAANVLNQKSGVFFFGTSGRIAQSFLGGTLCVRAPVVRTPMRSSGGSTGAPDCSGVLAIDLAPFLDGALGPGLATGAGVQGQWWYRDPQASFTVGLTDALEFLVLP
ncbi:MAG: hypothetical protein FJ294_10525 [Planctomycetes bacterium]|nr:hypothetical protein [Planctomycetota bacterium]